MAIVIACALWVPAGQANYIITLQEVGPNVVATGNGTIDLTGLTAGQGNANVTCGILPSIAYIVTGSPATGDFYTGFSGPTNFGNSSSITIASSCSGDQVGIEFATNDLYLPRGYISGQPLSDSSTYNNASFSSLGVTTGTYVWSWGAGPDQNFTLVIQAPTPTPTPVPEPRLSLLLALGVLLLVGARQRKIRPSGRRPLYN